MDARLPDPGDEEELVQPHRERSRRRRLAVDLAVAAAVLVVTGALAAKLGGGSKPAPTSAAPSHAPATASPSGFVTVTRVDGGWIPLPPVRTCPPDVQCLSSPAVSAPVRAAVREAFPGATITSARTVRLFVKNYGAALSALDIDARLGEARISLHLRGAAHTDESRTDTAHSDVLIFSGHRITRFETPFVQYFVVVEVVAPADRKQPLEPLVRLGTDLRLLAPW